NPYHTPLALLDPCSSIIDSLFEIGLTEMYYNNLQQHICTTTTQLLLLSTPQIFLAASLITFMASMSYPESLSSNNLTCNFKFLNNSSSIPIANSSLLEYGLDFGIKWKYLI
ncbi:hypothetical protein L195_g055940, partial [Trifolium pratense]